MLCRSLVALMCIISKTHRYFRQWAQHISDRDIFLKAHQQDWVYCICSSCVEDSRFSSNLVKHDFIWTTWISKSLKIILAGKQIECTNTLDQGWETLKNFSILQFSGKKQHICKFRKQKQIQDRVYMFFACYGSCFVAYNLLFWE